MCAELPEVLSKHCTPMTIFGVPSSEFYVPYGQVPLVMLSIGAFSETNLN